MESQGEAILTINNDYSENEFCEHDDFDECQPNLVKNSDLLVESQRTIITSDVEDEEDSYLNDAVGQHHNRHDDISHEASI